MFGQVEEAKGELNKKLMKWRRKEEVKEEEEKYLTSASIKRSYVMASY